jgi:D-proline reductase (dithiol) PrdB
VTQASARWLRFDDAWPSTVTRGIVSAVTTIERSFVSYIDRSRQYYAAQGYDTPYAWARHAGVPFAVLPKPLSKCRVGVVTTSSIWRDQPVVDGVLRGGKRVYSESADPPPEKLFTDDLAWDKVSTHTEDVASFLPLVQLAEFAARGRIAAAPVRFHGVPTDYSQRRTIEQDAPELLARLREDAVDVVLLAPL